MELKQTIEERKSIRIFKEDPIKKETIKELLEAARLAPSGTNIQPWRFLAVTSEDMRKKLADCTFNVNFIAKAPLTMVCCADISSFKTQGKRVKELKEVGAFSGTDLGKGSLKDYSKKTKRDEKEALSYLHLNVAIAVEHMILRGVDLGLGSCWVMLFDQEKVKELLDLPDNLQVTALVPFGYPAQEPKPRPRLELDDIYLGEV